jgi:hypothetical protein
MYVLRAQKAHLRVRLMMKHRSGHAINAIISPSESESKRPLSK